jgi:membrane fusion protein (multidrug efflux system)
MKTHKALIPMAICIAAGLISGCNKDGAAAPAKPANIDAVPVEVAAAARKPISASYSGTAALVTDHEAQVTSKASGVLKKLLVEEGMTVREGQLLAELDDSAAVASVAQAEALMHKADATFAYAEQSIKKNLIPKRDYDQANFDMLSQHAAYQTAKLQLAYTRIVAPVSGVIAERSVKLGNLIQINQNMFRIIGMDPLQAVLNVPERQLGILKVGQPVDLEADALTGRKFTGTILRVAPVVDAASGTFRVTCEFRGQSDLKPGMFGRIEIVYDHRDDALTVPRAALVEEDGETAVFVVDKELVATATAVASKDASGKTETKVTSTPAAERMVAHRKLVKIGYSDGDKVEIRGGIDEGAQVITVGRNAVRDGTSVQMLNAPGKDKALAEQAVAGAKA